MALKSFKLKTKSMSETLAESGSKLLARVWQKQGQKIGEVKMKNCNGEQFNNQITDELIANSHTKNSRTRLGKITSKRKNSYVIDKTSDAHFLKNLRLQLDMNRTEASKVLGFSISTLKRYESGISNLSIDKVNYFLERYCISKIDYMSFKAGKEITLSKEKIVQKDKVIENNHLRRSYKKVITDEIQALIHLRKIKEYSQYELTEKCGWHRTTINHIEQGRIELTEDKLKHILKILGFTLKKFKQYLDTSFDRKSVEHKCIKKILELDTEKLKSINAILENF